MFNLSYGWSTTTMESLKTDQRIKRFFQFTCSTLKVQNDLSFCIFWTIWVTLKICGNQYLNHSKFVITGKEVWDYYSINYAVWKLCIFAFVFIPILKSTVLKDDYNKKWTSWKVSWIDFEKCIFCDTVHWFLFSTFLWDKW